MDGGGRAARLSLSGLGRPSLTRPARAPRWQLPCRAAGRTRHHGAPTVAASGAATAARSVAAAGVTVRPPGPGHDPQSERTAPPPLRTPRGAAAQRARLRSTLPVGLAAAMIMNVHEQETPPKSPFALRGDLVFLPAETESPFRDF
jgi:hypothetical protein